MKIGNSYIYRIALNLKTFMIFVTLNTIMKILHKYLVTQGKNEEIFMTSQKFFSLNIYFGTEFKKSLKFFATKVWSYTVAM